MKVYRSFEQIERDLKILKLQQQINQEQLKLSINDTKDALSPVNFIAGSLGALAKKTIIKKITNKILGIKKVKTRNLEE